MSHTETSAISLLRKRIKELTDNANRRLAEAVRCEEEAAGYRSSANQDLAEAQSLIDAQKILIDRL